jgi:hypothetical protein
MVRTTALILAALTLTFAASAAQLEVSVGPEVQVRHYGIEYPNATGSTLRINATPENFGSANCMHSLKAKVGEKPLQYTRYSKPRALTSGKAEAVSITLLRLNGTGPVPVSLYATHCDRTVHLANFTYNQTQRLSTASRVEAETIRSNRTQLSFETPQIQNATLVPIDHPPVWKVGRTELEGGEATARIQPSVYSETKQITYAAIQDGEMAARVEVSLEEETDLTDRILAAVTRTDTAAASVLLNVVLVLILAFAYRQSLKRALAKLS